MIMNNHICYYYQSKLIHLTIYSVFLGNVIDPMHMIHGASLDKLNQELDFNLRYVYFIVYNH